MPTNSNTIERIRTAVNIARPGCARTYPESIIEIAPMLICNTLNQVGAFTNCGRDMESIALCSIIMICIHCNASILDT